MIFKLKYMESETMNQTHLDEIESFARQQLLSEIAILTKSLKFEKIDDKSIFDKRLNIPHHYVQWFQGSIYETDGTLALERTKAELTQAINTIIDLIIKDYHVEEFIFLYNVEYSNSLLTIHIEY